MTDIDGLANMLRKAGYTVIPPAPDPIYPTCHYCEANLKDDYLCSLTVTTNEGEEGFDTRTLLYCEEHEDIMHDVLEFLIENDFGTHFHGSTMFLTDPNCPGSKGGECPTPEESPYEREEPRL